MYSLSLLGALASLAMVDAAPAPKSCPMPADAQCAKYGKLEKPSIIALTNAANVKACAQACAETPLCLSVGFSKSSGDCSIFNSTLSSMKLESAAQGDVLFSDLLCYQNPCGTTTTSSFSSRSLSTTTMASTSSKRRAATSYSAALLTSSATTKSVTASKKTVTKQKPRSTTSALTTSTSLAAGSGKHRTRSKAAQSTTSVRSVTSMTSTTSMKSTQSAKAASKSAPICNCPIQIPVTVTATDKTRTMTQTSYIATTKAPVTSIVNTTINNAEFVTAKATMNFTEVFTFTSTSFVYASITTNTSTPLYLNLTTSTTSSSNSSINVGGDRHACACTASAGTVTVPATMTITKVVTKVGETITPVPTLTTTSVIANATVIDATSTEFNTFYATSWAVVTSTVTQGGNDTASMS